MDTLDSAGNSADAVNSTKKSGSSKKGKSKSKDKQADPQRESDIPVPAASEFPATELATTASHADATEADLIGEEIPMGETSKKKKKRKRDQDDDGGDVTVDGEKKKKKKKKKDKDGEAGVDGDPDGAASDKKKKKKKKSKKEGAAAGGEAQPETENGDAAGSTGMQIDTLPSTTTAALTNSNGNAHLDASIDAEGEAVEEEPANEDGHAQNDAPVREKKKKKKKDKEGKEGEGEGTEKKKKKKKKDKNASAADGQVDATSQPASTSTSLPPLPPFQPFQATVPAISYENIDPTLWGSSFGGVASTSSTSAPGVFAYSAPSGRSQARSESVAGSVSIQPRDPSLAPGDRQGSISAPGVSAVPYRPSSVAPASNPAALGEPAQPTKKRGRPKKSQLPDDNAALQAIAPMPQASMNQQAESSNAAAVVGSSSAAAAPAAGPETDAPPSASLARKVMQSTQAAQGRLGNVHPNTQARAALNPDFVPLTLPADGPQLIPSENTEELQELLAAKWMSNKDLAELVETQGLKYRSGKWAKAEDAALKLCIENYRLQQGLTEQQIEDIIFAKGRNSRSDFGDFWTIITRGIPDRPMQSVYHHTKRLLQPGARQGPWTPEEDAKLKAGFLQHGPTWEKIAPLVGRWSADCRDRYRNYVGPGHVANKGPWKKAEEEKLRVAVQSVRAEIEAVRAENGGVGLEDEPPGGSDMFWTRVSKKMDNLRSRHQCRIKWNDGMRNKVFTMEGKPIRWSRRDTFILIMKLHSLQVQFESDISWALLPDSNWNWWSVHVLQKRWQSMKARAIRKGKMKEPTFPDVIAWLKEEQDQIPRKIVRAFMMRRPGDEMGDEDAEAEDDVEDSQEGDTPAAQTQANGVANNSQSKFRTSEFVNSSADEEEDADGDGEDD